MHRHTIAIAVLLIVLVGCQQPLPGPAGPGGDRPDPVDLGDTVLGDIEVTIAFGDDADGVPTSSVRWSNDALGRTDLVAPGGIQLDLETITTITSGSGTDGGERFVSTTFRVRNADAAGTPYATSRQNLTFLGLNRVGGDAPTVAGTAVRSLGLFDGSSVAGDAASGLASEVMPTHGMRFDRVAGRVTLDEGAEDLQVLQESEIAPLHTLADDIARHVLPYGFVVRCRANCPEGDPRSLAANPAADQYDGWLTLAFRLPLQPSATEDPFSITLAFRVVDQGGVTRVTESVEEQVSTSSALARALALLEAGAPAVEVALLGSSETSVIGPNLTSVRICAVRTAGTAAAPTRFLVRSDEGPCATTVATLFDLVASQAVAAGEVTIVHAAGAEIDALTALQDGMILRAASDGAETRIAWVSVAGSNGPQVQVSFTLPSGAGSPTLGTARAFSASGAADVGPSTLTMLPADAPAVPSDPPSPVPLPHPSPPTLAAAFADHPLGDVTRSGAVDVRDALYTIERLHAGSADAFELYHSDVDANDVTDLADVALLLDKVVDASLPAALHVKPRRLSYVQLDPDTDQTGLVLVANRGNQPLAALDWATATGIVSTVLGGLADQSVALSLTMPRPVPKGWLPQPFRVDAGPGGSADVMLGNVVVLIAGQSNAVGIGHHEGTWPEVSDPGVRMLGNDYAWKNASEPLDSDAGQLDSVSADLTARYSLGTYLGHLLRDTFDAPAYLIPAAKSGSEVDRWRPRSNVLSRSTLFGSANYRAHVSSGAQPNPAADPSPAEGGPLSLVIWYQGEAENTVAKQALYVDSTNFVMDTFFAEHGTPTVYVQLATDYRVPQNQRYGAVAEMQRRMESGSDETEERDAFFMVVANDLPRAERNHLSSFGLRILAERIDLAVRERILGHDVDGTGPRLQAVEFQGATVRVRTNRILREGALDASWFTVFDGPPTGTLDDAATYGTNAIDIAGVALEPGDPTTVLITLVAASNDVPHVRYLPPSGQLPQFAEENPEVWTTIASDVVRDALSELPLPTFGPLAATEQP